jgi:hypothetical protein
VSAWAAETMTTFKHLIVTSIFLCSSLGCLKAQQDTKDKKSIVVSPDDRSALVANSNNRVVAAGVVISVAQEPDQSANILNFSKDPKGFSARLVPSVYAKLQPLDAFVGKAVKVAGIVRLLDDKPEIRVTDIGQLEFAKAPEPNVGSSPFPTAVPVPGKPGFVTSPHNPEGGFIDVRGFLSGTEVKDPYSGKMFLVP